MGRLPDLTPIFVLAAFGLIVALVGGVSLIGWAGYHFFRALALYLGAAS